MESSRVAVVIMAKAPRAGHVKTRLCPPLSPDEASALYECFLRDKIAQVRTLAGVTGVIAFTPDDSGPLFGQLAPGFRLVAQRGGDLGSRLLHTLETLLGDGHAAAIAVDSDTPTLPTDFLRQAVELLSMAKADVVLGPADDGGYYLIGLRQPWPTLFADMPWSTPDVLPETMRRAEAARLSVACLPPWFDVDTPDDLGRLVTSLGGDGGPAHTRRFLRRRSG